MRIASVGQGLDAAARMLLKDVRLSAKPGKSQNRGVMQKRVKERESASKAFLPTEPNFPLKTCGVLPGFYRSHPRRAYGRIVLSSLRLGDFAPWR
jgi:hypothetical protein